MAWRCNTCMCINLAERTLCEGCMEPSPHAPPAAAAAASSATRPTTRAGSSAAAAARRPDAATDERASKKQRIEAAEVPASQPTSNALFHEISQRMRKSHKPASLDTSRIQTEWFVDEVPDKLICAMCLEVARDPPNLESCSHAVCRSCLDECVKKSGKKECPTCRVSFAKSRLASNLFAQAMVWPLRVKCPQHERGCSWQGDLGVDCRNLIAHDATCTFKPAPCPACKIVLTPAQALVHAGQCSHRLVACASCSKQVEFLKLFQHQPAYTAQWHLEEDESKTQPAASSSAAAASLWSASNLLPPRVPPCINMQLCPNRCEDPKHPGYRACYLKSARAAHQETCSRRPLVCTLCTNQHTLPACAMATHVTILLSDPAKARQADTRLQSLFHPPAPDIRKVLHTNAVAAAAVVAEDPASFDLFRSLALADLRAHPKGHSVRRMMTFIMNLIDCECESPFQQREVNHFIKHMRATGDIFLRPSNAGESVTPDEEILFLMPPHVQLQRHMLVTPD